MFWVIFDFSVNIIVNFEKKITSSIHSSMDKKPNMTVWGNLNRFGFHCAPPMLVYRHKSTPTKVVHRPKSYTAHGRTSPQVDTVQSRTPPQVLYRPWSYTASSLIPPMVVHRLKSTPSKVVHRPKSTPSIVVHRLKSYTAPRNSLFLKSYTARTIIHF